MSELYSLRDAGMRYNGAEVLHPATLDFSEAQMVALVGPNGAGKSTLLGIMAGLRPGYPGRCAYGGKEVRRWPRRAFAREVSFVPQSVRVEFPFTAEQVVMMGRTPYCDGLFESPEDRAAVERAMATHGHARVPRPRFSIAQRRREAAHDPGLRPGAVAASPAARRADHFLDLQHQVSIYRLLRDLARQGLLVVAVTHDLNLAAAYSDRVVVLRAGEVVRDAAPLEVLSPETIRAVFGVEAEVRHTQAGKPWILYGD